MDNPKGLDNNLDCYGEIENHGHKCLLISDKIKNDDDPQITEHVLSLEVFLDLKPIFQTVFPQNY